MVFGVGRGDVVVSWLMFYVTLIQTINNPVQNCYHGKGGQEGGCQHSDPLPSLYWIVKTERLIFLIFHFHYDIITMNN